MTDLQLGLVLLGAVAVGAVVLYNRLQERSARGQAEKALGPRSADVLMGEAAMRREPTLEPLARRDERPSQPPVAMPDPRIDYVIELDSPGGVIAGTAAELWRGLEHRFARRAMFACSDGEAWRAVHAGDPGRVSALRAGLQLVGRAGVASESEVLEFRSEVETIGAKLGASHAAPEIRAAMAQARELDAFCADADIQVAMHVVASGEDPLDAGSVAGAKDEAAQSDAPFEVALAADRRSLVLTLDVPRTSDVGRAYEGMVRAARDLAAALGGKVVDDRGTTLDERALSAIAGQLEGVVRTLADRGIEPGSPLAKRLFS